MEAVFEGRDDAEVSPTAAHPPEEIRILGGTDRQELAIRSDDIDAEEVITGEPVFACQPAQAPAQRQTRDPRRGVRAASGGETKRLRFVIEFSPCDPALSTGRAPEGINTDALHPRQVNHEAALTHRVASDVVAPATHGHQQVVSTGEVHRVDDVRHARTPRKQRRFPVDHAIPDLAGVLIASLPRTQQRAPQPRVEVVDGGFLEDSFLEHRAPRRDNLLVCHDASPSVCSGSTLAPNA